jgi:hypothetical protein
VGDVIGDLAATGWALLIGGVAALAGLAVAWWRGHASARRASDNRNTRAALDAERNRTRIEDEIQAETDLAARARRSGLVRPDR